MMNIWDRRFLELAKHISEWSDYPGRKIGAVITDKTNVVVSIGINSMPNGIDASNKERYYTNDRLKWFEHAERNAIFNARVSLIDSKIYINFFPCMECARAIVQCGISEVIAFQPNLDDPDWGYDFELSMQLF